MLHRLLRYKQRLIRRTEKQQLQRLRLTDLKRTIWQRLRRRERPMKPQQHRQDLSEKQMQNQLQEQQLLQML